MAVALEAVQAESTSCCWHLGGLQCNSPDSEDSLCLPVDSVSREEELGTMTVSRTCKIASLCISWSVQAGIIAFKVPNSSFIFDLRLLSITLWAVFLAIFLPATLFELGCFFPAVVVVLEDFLFEPLVPCCIGVLDDSSEGCGFGFIWMMVRDLVGGGGKEKAGFDAD